MDSSSAESIKLSACVRLERDPVAVTQDTACESNGKTASFQGSSLFFGGPLSGLTGGSGKDETKQRRRVYSHNDVVLQFDFTVKSFPGIIVGGKKHDRGLLQTLCCD